MVVFIIVSNFFMLKLHFQVSFHLIDTLLRQRRECHLLCDVFASDYIRVLTTHYVTTPRPSF